MAEKAGTPSRRHCVSVLRVRYTLLVAVLGLCERPVSEARERSHSLKAVEPATAVKGEEEEEVTYQAERGPLCQMDRDGAVLLYRGQQCFLRGRTRPQPLVALHLMEQIGRTAEPQHQPNAQILCVQESIDEGVGSSASQPAAMFNTSSPKQTTGKTPPVERRRQSRHDWHAGGRQHVNGA